MNKELQQIPARIRELREILEISAFDLASSIGISYETYSQYETGGLDIPISTLFEIANHLGTDLTVLLTGEAPRMDNVSLIRGGNGASVERFPGYNFSSLAFNFKNRTMEPLLVEIEPSTTPKTLVTHSGQEFNYVLEGIVKVVLGKREYVLLPGDSIYFNPRVPHGQYALESKAKFLTVIQE